MSAGVARALQREQRAGRRRARGVDQHVGRIDHQRPDLAEVVRRSRFLSTTCTGRRRAREAQRLGEGPIASPPPRRSSPTRRRSTRSRASRGRGASSRSIDLEAGTCRGWCRRASAPRSPGQGSGSTHHALEREALLARVAGVEVVDPQRLRGAAAARRRRRRARAARRQRPARPDARRIPISWRGV